MIYNKLVRDHIPEIIADKGGRAVTRILSDDEYLHYLEAKLDEEVGEYHSDKSVEELADIMEVLFALADASGCTKEQLYALYRKKHDERGGFSQKILLISSEE